MSESFGELTFSADAQRNHLPREAYESLQQVVRRQKKLDPALAMTVAHGMKEWAQRQGATHFCHWFHPQTGLTAEKHDSFLSLSPQGEPLARFCADNLFRGEPDASSLPSGGARTTFEARGYTTWDPTSPAFIIESGGSRTLSIPSHFLSYDGQALDEKTPLLRSMDLVRSRCATAFELMGLAGTNVHPTCGVEQEFFLMDRDLATLRPDVLLAGRTLVGNRPAKGQELEDHYFGTIRERVLAFLDELEIDLIRLGVPIKTRHNEVAPMQFEVAPLYEEANIAADHDHLVMARARIIAQRHHFALLLHEKPFERLNGSGKHVNWSLRSEEGENLLEPGDSPSENLRFLVILCAVLEGLHMHGGSLRASVASAGNDLRLGANEAPPAIMSVFVGTGLEQLLDDWAHQGPTTVPTNPNPLSLGLSHLQDLPRDTTDRNRTAPVAFTGNKFEFRAVGSAQSVGFPVAIFNAAIADGIERLTSQFRRELVECNDPSLALAQVVSRSLQRTAPIRFSGNCYDESWLQEAMARGLPHHPHTPAALYALEGAATSFLTEPGTFSHTELEGRRRVRLQRYCHTIDIEATCLEDLVDTHIVPCLVDRLATYGTIDIPRRTPLFQRYRRLRSLTNDLLKSLDDMRAVRRRAAEEKDDQRRSFVLAELVLPAMDQVRRLCDEGESLVADHQWPLPKYRELLFLG